MIRNNFIKFYRVFKNDTAVTEISSNDFKPIINLRTQQSITNGQTVDVLITIPIKQYSLPADKDMFYGYFTKSHAMEMAKAGALKYIELLISKKNAGAVKLKQYRDDHYDDLNTYLLEANIRKAENDLNIN